MKNPLILALLLTAAGCGAPPTPPPIVVYPRPQPSAQEIYDAHERRLEKQREDYLASHPFHPVFSPAIREGRVVVGMSTEQVRATWGKPVSVTTTSEGNESWRYGGLYRETTYLWFRQGKLHRWSQTK